MMLAPNECQCGRLAFLRCVECQTCYCSGSCQLKDWENHRQLHLSLPAAEVKISQTLQVMADRLHPEIVSGNAKMSVQDRLDQVMRPSQSAANVTNKSIHELKLYRGEMFGSNAVTHTENLIKAESIAKSSMSESMKNLAKGIDEIQFGADAKTDVEMKDEACALEKAFEAMEIDGDDHKIKPLDNYIQIIENFDRPIVLLHKYNRSAPIPPDVKDLEGFFFVRVTHIDKLNNGDFIFSLNLSGGDSKEEIEYYKQQLNIQYSSNTIADEIPYQQVAKMKLLYMAKLNNQWSRCRLISTENDQKTVLDIDTGKRHILTRNTPVKIACEPEMMKSALAFRVKIINLVDPSSVDVGDLLKIKMIQSNIYGISTVEAVMEGTEAQQEAAVNDWKEEGVRPKTPESRHMINEIQGIELPLGPQTLVYLDGSLIQEGKIQVREDSPKVARFYIELEKNIQDYIRKHPNLNNYKPIVGELILAIYPDEDKAYRAFCIGVSVIDCKIFFIDYGSELVVTDFADIWKMPTEFVKECLSVSIEVKLRSGRSLKDADVDATMELLAEAEKISTVVELKNGKRVITLDESLIGWKTK